MGYYNKYPGYIIRQREENTGSLNPYKLRLTGSIFLGTVDNYLFERSELPFLFHQPNMPSYKSGQPYRVVSGHVDDGDDNEYNWNDWGPRDNTDFFISDIFDYPTYTNYIGVFTVPKSNFYITDFYFQTVDLGSNPGVNIIISVGLGGGSSICVIQTFNDPSFGAAYEGTIFKIPFNPASPGIVERGPFNAGDVITVKNGYDYTFDLFKARVIIKGYYK